MKISKSVLLSIVLATMLMTSMLFVGTGSVSNTKLANVSAGEYDPWKDINDDGVIEMMDFFLLSQAYMTSGTPIAKASIEYDSGWISITDKQGQNITVTHGLNSDDIMVDITGKMTVDGGQHQRQMGTADYYYTAGWNKTYGGIGNDDAYALVQTTDGGYAIAGSTASFGAGSYDFWLIKTNANGNAQWAQTYGGADVDTARALVQTGDGGYALAGCTRSSGAGDYDSWLVKTDSLGHALWNKTYGGTNTDVANALVQTVDGGYALAGYTVSYGAGTGDFWLVKTDGSGNAQWSKTYGGGYSDSAYGLVQTVDGGYALAGYTGSYGAGIWDFWLVKTGSSGNMQWNRTYGGVGFEEAYALVQTSDGGYALAGLTESFGAGSQDFWLVKTDGSGNVQWNRTYGGTGGDGARSLIQTGDGGYALAGVTIPLGSGYTDAYLVKTDSAGNMQWNKTYGGSVFDEAYALVQASDGRYALAGYTWSYGVGGHDFWLIKTDGEVGSAYGFSWIDSTLNSIILYRGSADPYWNYVRVRVWKVKENP